MQKRALHSRPDLSSVDTREIQQKSKRLSIPRLAIKHRIGLDCRIDCEYTRECGYLPCSLQASDQSHRRATSLTAELVDLFLRECAR